MLPNLFPLTAIVLAGGESRRMGRDKARLVLDGEALLARTVRVVAAVCREVVVVGPETLAPLVTGTRVVRDEVPGRGPLSGIATGLEHISNDRALVVACDLPFLNPDLLRHLISLAPGCEAVVPNIDGIPQPTHAVYSRGIGPIVRECLSRHEYTLESVLTALDVRWVASAEIERFDPQHLSFFNVNTVKDWERAKNRMSSTAVSFTGGPHA